MCYEKQLSFLARSNEEDSIYNKADIRRVTYNEIQSSFHLQIDYSRRYATAKKPQGLCISFIYKSPVCVITVYELTYICVYKRTGGQRERKPSFCLNMCIYMCIKIRVLGMGRTPFQRLF